jgi:hypothetical protein
VCEVQPGDDPPTPFSFLHLQQPGWRPPARQVPCHGTRTTAASEALVLECMAAGGWAAGAGGRVVVVAVTTLSAAQPLAVVGSARLL